jgi:hypothetical protein
MSGRKPPPTDMPAPGDHYVYEHSKGLGHEARGDVLTAEMNELDMQPGTEVVVVVIDDAGWPIVNWTDQKGLDRMTAIETTTFGTYFTKVV